VYKLIAGTWQQQGIDLDGEAEFDASGGSVSMSADGLTVAIGAAGNDEIGSNAGHVRVYYLCTNITGTDTQVACDSYTWIDGTTYTESNNIATFTLPNSVDCDSVVTLNLTINSVDVSVTETLPTLTANATGATYQWLDCNNSSATIGGETAQVFTAVTNGNYAVEVTENGCTDTSICYVITTIGIIENSFENELLVYPNPTSGSFSIDLGQQYQTIEISMTDINGKLIYRNTYNQSQLLTLEVNEPAGVYLFTVVSDDRNAVVRVIKE